MHRLFAMGCIASTPENASDEGQDNERLISDAVDRSLNRMNKAEKNQIRLFLLGAGESGKSTVLKQMRLLHNHSFTDLERESYARVIWVDMVESMKLLLFNARRFKIPLDCDQPGLPLTYHKRVLLSANETYESVGNFCIDDYAVGYTKKPQRGNEGDTSLLSSEDDESHKEEVLPSKNWTKKDIAMAIWELWSHDKGIRECFAQSSKFQLESSAEYYFENVFNLATPNYRCTNRDIIMGRIKTTGITENTFSIKNTTLKVLDAGGQRAERKKWIHFFQDIDAIVFVLAVSEYNQTLYEDARVNRVDESLALFLTLCNSPTFRDTPFIVFLNKADLLKSNLKLSPITNYFTNYDKDPLNVDQVLDYFEQTILALNRTRKPIYVHRTCATDTDAMRFVLNAVTDMMVQQNLKKSGLI